MTNPNNAIGTNGAYSGRTSVDAFNDILSAFNGRGIVSGWSISPSSGMTITLGGVSGIRDVAIAVATGGAKTTINNRSGSPVSLTIEAAPATNSRIDAIVAYVSNPPQGTTELADNPSACGLIAVKGTTATTPTVPDEDAIRTAITADGAVGSTAYYVVLGTVKVVAGVTTLTSNYITQGVKAGVGTDNIADSAVTSAKIADSAVTSDKIDFTTFNTASSQVKTVTWENGYGTNLTAHRFGNLVWCNCETKATVNLPTTGDWSRMTEVVPYGYRPCISNQMVIVNRSDGNTMLNRYSKEGYIDLNSSVAGTPYVRYNFCWITADDMPS